MSVEQRQNWPFPTMWEEETIPLKCSYTRNLIQISWRETSAINVYNLCHLCFMILKIFRIFFSLHQKKATGKRTWQKHPSIHIKNTTTIGGMACFGLLSHFVLGWSRSSCFWGCLSFRKISKLHGQGDPIATWDLIWQFLFRGGMIWMYSLWSWGWICVGVTVFSMSEKGLRWLVRFQPFMGREGESMNIAYEWLWNVMFLFVPGGFS